MKRLVGVLAVAAAVLALLAGNSLAGQAGGQCEDDPLQTKLQTRTCEQTCDPAQDCDGNQIQYRPRTRQNWPNDEAEIEFLLWLLGLE